MPTFANPTDIARETFKLLSARRLAPSPENYQQIYNEVSGKPSGPDIQSADKILQLALQGMAKKNPALKKSVAMLDRAIEERDLKGMESGFTALVGQADSEDAAACAVRTHDDFRGTDGVY